MILSSALLIQVVEVPGRHKSWFHLLVSALVVKLKCLSEIPNWVSSLCLEMAVDIQLCFHREFFYKRDMRKGGGSFAAFYQKV